MKFWLPFVLGNVLLTTSVANRNMNAVRRTETLEQSHIRTRIRGGKTFFLKVSFAYENSNGQKWKLDKNLIKDAVKIVSNVFENLNVKIVLQDVKEITDDRRFRVMRKSTNDAVLKKFLKYKQRLMNSKHNENLQLITRKSLGLDHALAGVATFQTVCSPESSGGIIIGKHWETSHLAVIMAHNLACIMGISKKNHCHDGFRETDTKCRNKRKPLTTNEITDCIMNELDVHLKHNLNALCEENGRIPKVIPQKIQQTADDDDIDEERKPSKLVLILVALGGGGFLLITIVVAAYKLKKNYDKERLLKDRVTVEYNYEAGKRRHTRPSVINDPTITLDLDYGKQ